MKYSQDNNPKRQKLIGDKNLDIMMISKSANVYQIDTLDDLKSRLQDALLVEHFTIPPYLCALYTIKDGTNEDASRLIRTVVMEEMLHLVMVANLINAIGGTPLISPKELLAASPPRSIPWYPSPLPKSSGDFEVGLVKFSKEAINTFLRIEKPAKAGSLPEIDRFHSIGQFYAAIREAIIRLDKEAQPDGIFIGDRERQVTSEHYYGSGGRLIEVYDQKTALATLDEIVGQGEGIDGTIHDADDSILDDDVEYAHYFRFNEIFNERFYTSGDKPNAPPTGAALPVDWNDVYNMEPNPTMAQYQNNPWLLEKMEAFNRTYTKLLDNIHCACNGHPRALIQGIPLMYRLKEQATELMKIPNGNGNYTAGPSFEYMPETK